MAAPGLRLVLPTLWIWMMARRWWRMLPQHKPQQQQAQRQMLRLPCRPRRGSSKHRPKQCTCSPYQPHVLRQHKPPPRPLLCDLLYPLHTLRRPPSSRQRRLAAGQVSEMWNWQGPWAGRWQQGGGES